MLLASHFREVMVDSNPKHHGAAYRHALDTYQVVLYDRSLHPEFFDIKSRRSEDLGSFAFDSWVLEGGHVLQFRCEDFCVAELVTSQDRGLPDTGVVAAFLCAGERDYDHAFAHVPLNYISTVQTEVLSAQLYNSTLEELLAFAVDSGAIIHQWQDGDGDCASIIDMQGLSSEVHVQTYHMIASLGLVVRTQSIFELRHPIVGGALPRTSRETTPSIAPPAQHPLVDRDVAMSLYFDLADFSYQDVARILLLFSELYVSVGGDGLVVEDTQLLEIPPQPPVAGGGE